MSENPVNCWKPLRAEALQRSEQSQARQVEKSSDWAISSQADAKAPEGSTTRASRLTPRAQALYSQGLTVRQIEKEIGVPSRTISRWLRESGVTMRKPGETAKTQRLTSQELQRLYVQEDKSAEAIAVMWGVTPVTVRKKLREFGIQVRESNKGRKFGPEMGEKISKALKGRFVGSNNPNWRGSDVKEYRRMRTTYEAKQWSQMVKERDGWKCVKCGSVNDLQSHHIKRWRANKAHRFDISNGMTLCRPCHADEHREEIKLWVTSKAPRVQGTLHG